MPFVIRSAAPTLAEAYAALEASRAAAGEYLTCPIARETLDPEHAVLASDGYLYDLEALRAWAESRARNLQPVLSPVTRQVLRPWVVPAREFLREAGIGEEGGRPMSEAKGSGQGGPSGPSGTSGTSGRAGSGGAAHAAAHAAPAAAPAAAPIRPLPLLRAPPAAPFSPLIETRTGTQRASRWSTPLGVACRMLLRWDEGDVIEWCFPAAAESRTILTPPPARELLPLARPILAWLGLSPDDFANPDHILTAWVRVHRPALDGEAGPGESDAELEDDDDPRVEAGRRRAEGEGGWAPLELFLLRLNRPPRARGL